MEQRVKAQLRPGQEGSSFSEPSEDIGSFCLAGHLLHKTGQSGEDSLGLLPKSPHSTFWSFDFSQFKTDMNMLKVHDVQL